MLGSRYGIHLVFMFWTSMKSFSSIPYKLLNGLSFLLDTKIKRIIFGPLRDTIVTTLNFSIGGLKFESPEMEIYGLGENLTLFYDSKRREGRGY